MENISYYNHHYDTKILYLHLSTLLPMDSCEALTFILIKVIMLVLQVLYEYELKVDTSSGKKRFNNVNKRILKYLLLMDYSMV